MEREGVGGGFGGWRLQGVLETSLEAECIFSRMPPPPNSLSPLSVSITCPICKTRIIKARCTSAAPLPEKNHEARFCLRFCFVGAAVSACDDISASHRGHLVPSLFEGAQMSNSRTAPGFCHRVLPPPLS